MWFTHGFEVPLVQDAQGKCKPSHLQDRFSPEAQAPAMPQPWVSSDAYAARIRAPAYWTPICSETEPRKPEPACARQNFLLVVHVIVIVTYLLLGSKSLHPWTGNLNNPRMVTQADRGPPLFARPMLSVKIKPDLQSLFKNRMTKVQKKHQRICWVHSEPTLWQSIPWQIPPNLKNDLYIGLEYLHWPVVPFFPSSGSSSALGSTAWCSPRPRNRISKSCARACCFIEWLAYCIYIYTIIYIPLYIYHYIYTYHYI